MSIAVLCCGPIQVDRTHNSRNRQMDLSNCSSHLQASNLQEKEHLGSSSLLVLF
ncbi:hypothetical protein Hanom_Chr00s027418g01767081 [Helianthus anomalus]